jgi:polar amino acid transport system permease protein
VSHAPENPLSGVGSAPARPAPAAPSPPQGRRGRLRPSYLVLLAALPLVVYLFVSAPEYTRALAYIGPGLGITVAVTVAAYGGALVLGLGLAGLLLLKLGRRTLLTFGVFVLAALLGSLFFFTRPPVTYALVGEPGGRVAIIQGTPSRVVTPIQTGRYAGEGAEGAGFAIRAAASTEAALTALDEGTVSAAFIPQEALPAGANVLWETTFLPPGARNPALVLGVIGVLLGMLTAAAARSREHPLAIFAELYVDMIRGIPMLVIILYVGFPLQAALRDATGGLLNMPILMRGGVAIALGYAAYMAEIFRAGIEAIPKGQLEAARSLGLTRAQSARFVVLPQALRIVTPPLGNEFIAMLKDTSLLSILGVRELTQLTREYQASNFQVFPPFNTVALLYIGLTLAASSLLKWLEGRTKFGK